MPATPVWPAWKVPYSFRQKGIQRVHIKNDDRPAQLCLHFDANLISLAAVRRLAQQTGSDFTQRYRHQRLPIGGMDAADAAAGLAQVLARLDRHVARQRQLRRRPGLCRLRHPPIGPAGHRRRHSPHGLRATGSGTVEALPLSEDEGQSRSGPLRLLPRWVRERWTFISVALAGLFLLIGWLGETYFWACPKRSASSFMPSPI